MYVCVLGRGGRVWVCVCVCVCVCLGGGVSVHVFWEDGRLCVLRVGGTGMCVFGGRCVCVRVCVCVCTRVLGGGGRQRRRLEVGAGKQVS